MNILVVSIRAMGDVLRTSFIAQALKEKYSLKDPKIYWMTDPRLHTLFSNNPYVDSFINEKERESLKNKKFDMVINFEDSFEDAKFVGSLNFKKIIGAYINDLGKLDYSPESSYWFDMSLSSKMGVKKADYLKKKNRKTHREILSEMISVNPKKYEPFLRLTKKQRKIAKDFLRRYNLSNKDLIIGVNTGSSDTWPKSLSPKKTAELIDRIYGLYRSKILLFGGPNESERNEKIKKLCNSPIIDTGCGNDLYEFPAIVSVTKVFITTDSLGLHVSLALKRKTICLIGPTSPHEIDLYGLGKKVISKSNEVCTYRKATKNCMDKISISDVERSLKKILSQKITLLITALKEPNTICRAIESALNQETHFEYNVVLSCPDEETISVSKKYLKNKKFKIIEDPGKGKSHALNFLFNKIITDILILTDGDVWISKNSIEEISNIFLDPEVGCATGRPVPIEDKSTKYGFWANFLFDSAHAWREKAAINNSFLECSGYLFAFRKSKISNIPLDVAEDAVIPYFIWEKGYKVSYVRDAEVYVKNVNNWNDWVTQKIRTSKSHQNLSKYVDIKTTPRVKSFTNELKGVLSLIRYPKNFKEIFWAIQLAFARFYMWNKVYLDMKINNSKYEDAWKRVESTK